MLLVVGGKKLAEAVEPRAGFSLLRRIFARGSCSLRAWHPWVSPSSGMDDGAARKSSLNPVVAPLTQLFPAPCSRHAGSGGGARRRRTGVPRAHRAVSARAPRLLLPDGGLAGRRRRSPAGMLDSSLAGAAFIRRAVESPHLALPHRLERLPGRVEDQGRAPARRGPRPTRGPRRAPSRRRVPTHGSVPCPASLYLDGPASPESRYSARESVGFAFLAALQLLPPKQRATLIACDELGWSAEECAELIETSTVSVESALRRARKTIELRAERWQPKPPDAETTRALLARWVAAWDRADAAGLVALLHEDATMSMPPLPFWLHGSADIAASIGRMVFTPGAAGSFRFVATEANGLPAFAVHRRATAGDFVPYALQVLSLERDSVRGLIAFLDLPLVGGVRRPVGRPRTRPTSADSEFSAAAIPRTQKPPLCAHPVRVFSSRALGRRR